MKSEKKIIVIEDEKDINRLITYNLKKQGFSVKQVFDGSVAQETLKNECFDIVILDIMLPGVDGFHICKTIKENPNAFRTFIIVVSAKDHSEDKLYAYILGADCYFAKPFNIRMLMNKVNEINALQNQELIVTAK